MTAPAFTPENALEEALLEACRRSELEPLLAGLADAEVFLPSPAAAPSPGDELRVVPRAGEEVALPVLEAQGESFVPVFSSLAQLGRARPAGGGYVRLAARALAAVLPAGCGLVLNPGGDLGLPLDVDAVDRFRELAGCETEFLLGEPREEPVALLDALRRFAGSRPEVRAAYRAQIVRRPGAAPEPVVGLLLEPDADAAATIAAAAEAARAAGLERLALLPLAGAGDRGPVAGFLLGRTRPFFERG